VECGLYVQHEMWCICGLCSICNLQGGRMSNGDRVLQNQ